MHKREGIEPRYERETVGADAVSKAEGHIQGAARARAPANPPGSKTGARHHGRAGNSGGPLGSSHERSRVAHPAHREDARRPRGSRMLPYERGRGGTPTEQRGAHAAARSMATPPTPRGGAAVKTGIERIVRRARQEPQTRYTSLRHPFTVEHLRACFVSLEGKKATGGDGVTKAMYEQHLEANRQALHQKLPQMSSRPQPVRRVESPTEDGRPRPWGLSCLADKIVQEMARHLLDAIDEPVFIDTS